VFKAYNGIFRVKITIVRNSITIQASKLLKIPFTAAIDILVRMYEKGVLEKQEAREKLEAQRKYGRYKKEIIEDAKSRLEVR